MIRLPAEVRDLAQRCGATGKAHRSQVSLTQTGEMRGGAADRWRRFHAHQSIALTHPAFRWSARTGPLGAIGVVDALGPAGARLRVRALGLLPVAQAAPCDALTKGEAMRYLAELPWAPDAMLLDRALDWQVLDDRRLRVSTGRGAARATVDLRLGQDGLVAEVSALDRPRLEGQTFVERPWRGRFTCYLFHAGRRLPYHAEVCWTLDGAEVPVWRGQLLTWAIA